MPTKRECKISEEKWQLDEGYSINALSSKRESRDRLLWHHYELGFTLVGTHIRAIVQGAGIDAAPYNDLPLSADARRGLKYFLGLFPEWLKEMPYMAIKLPEREKRLDLLFQDDHLALEPTGKELLDGFYQLLLTKKCRGEPLVIPGIDGDIFIYKRPWVVPLKNIFPLIQDSMTRFYKSSERNAAKIKSRRKSRSKQLQKELRYCGRYRLLEAYRFNVAEALRASGGKADDLFYDARRFMEHLLQKRWELAETHFDLLKAY
jgi:hypothetical protein